MPKGFQIGQKNIGDIVVLVDVPKKSNFCSGTQETQHAAVLALKGLGLTIT
jgi:hypothetical protein